MANYRNCDRRFLEVGLSNWNCVLDYQEKDAISAAKRKPIGDT